MKTVLIFDTTFPKGHRELNNRLLRLLSELPINLIVLTRGDYYFVKKNNIKYVQCKSIKVRKGMVLSRVCLFINFLLSKLSILFKRYESVVYTTYPNVNISIELFFYKRSTEILLIGHNNIDLLASKNIRNIFLMYANKVKHIVFAPFIKEYLISIGVDNERIFILPHPINLESNFSKNKKNIALSMGLESNESYLRKLVEVNSNTKFLNKCDMKLIIRSKDGNFSSTSSIEVIRNYLSREEYEELYRNAKYTFVFYPMSYQNRFSGVIMDSLASGCVVIGNRIPIVEYFANLYPNNCRCVDSIDEIPQLVSTNIIYSEEEGNAFFKEFSESSIKDKLSFILGLNKVYSV
jgi:hypothetical protein